MHQKKHCALYGGDHKPSKIHFLEMVICRLQLTNCLAITLCGMCIIIATQFIGERSLHKSISLSKLGTQL